MACPISTFCKVAYEQCGLKSQILRRFIYIVARKFRKEANILFYQCNQKEWCEFRSPVVSLKKMLLSLKGQNLKSPVQ